MRNTTVAWIAALMVAVLIAGCTRAKPEAPPAPPGDKTPPVEPAPAPVPPDPITVDWLTLEPASGVLRRLQFQPGQAVAVSAEGMYLMDGATGKVEAWVLETPSPAAYTSAFNAAGDGRWVIARDADHGFLVDRTNGTVHRWSRSQAELIAAGPDRLVFEQVEAQGESRWAMENFGPGGHQESLGRFAVLNGDRTPVGTFAPADIGRMEAPRPAVLSPDGKHVALGGSKLYLADLTAGSARAIDAGHTPDAIQPLSGGKGFIVSSAPAELVHVQAYAWDGASVGGQVPGGVMAPGGDRVAVTSFLEEFIPAVTLLDTASGQPVLRVTGATTCYGWGGAGGRWRSDGSGLFVDTRGGRRLVTTAGEIKEVPGISGEGFHEPIPAPKGAGLVGDLSFMADQSIVLSVLDGSGKKVSATLTRGTSAHNLRPAVGVSLWGESDRELRLSMIPHLGRGGACGDYAIPLPPRVERPPFAQSLLLQVQNTGDCLNLREQANLSASVVTCLRDGAKVTVAKGEYGAQTWGDGQQWAHVRTEDGKTGWASVSSGNLRWAP